MRAEATLGGTDPFDRRSRGLGGPGALGAVGHRVAGCGLEAVSRLARPLRAQPGRPGWFPADGGHRAAVARARDHVPTTQWVQIAVPGYVAAQIVAAYWFSGFAKLISRTWGSGDAFRRIAGLGSRSPQPGDETSRVFFFSFLAAYPPLVLTVVHLHALLGGSP